MSFNLEFLAKSRISSRNFRFFRLNFVGILEFLGGFLRLYHLRILEFHIEIAQRGWGMT